jgi:hypothetical protein
MRHHTISLCAFLALSAAGLAPPARAQMQLPGAGAAAAPAPAEQGVPVRAPEEAGVVGRELRLNGAQGRIRLERRGSDLLIARLTLAGERLSRRGEACEVEIAEGPFPLKPLRRVEGLRRYEANLPACPLTLEILTGALQTHVGDGATGGACAFAAADCRAFAAGVWGPAASAISDADIAQIERARATAERNAMANYRALVAAAGKDRDKVRVAAAEQASFSSRRAERCGDYAGEERHGFYASRVTEAWAVALRARLNPAAFDNDETVGATRRPGAARAAAR